MSGKAKFLYEKHFQSVESIAAQKRKKDEENLQKECDFLVQVAYDHLEHAFTKGQTHTSFHETSYLRRAFKGAKWILEKYGVTLTLTKENDIKGKVEIYDRYDISYKT